MFETFNTERYFTQLYTIHVTVRNMRQKGWFTEIKFFCSLAMRYHTFPEQLSKNYTFHYESSPHFLYSSKRSSSDYLYIKYLGLTDRVFRPTVRVPTEKGSSMKQPLETTKEILRSRKPGFYITLITGLLSRWEKCVSNAVCLD